MALTIEQQPPAVVLAGNPLPFTVHTDQHVTSAGTKALVRVQFTEAELPTVGDAINLESAVLGVDYTFQCTASPSGLTQFAAPSAGQSVADYLDAVLIPALLATSGMHSNYTAYRVGDELRIEALDFGASYTLGTFNLSGFAPTVNSTAGVDLELAGAKIRGRVRLAKTYTNGTPIYSSWFYLDPDNEGRAEFDCAELVRLLWESLDTPNQDLATLKRNTLTIRRFSLELAEHIGSDPFTQPLTVTPPFVAVLGGFSTYDQDLDFATQAAGAWLTNRKSGVLHQPATVDFLHFLTAPDLVAGPATGKARVFYTDGTTADQDIWSFANLEPSNLYTTPFGFQSLNLDTLNPSKEAYRFEVWVEHASAEIVPHFSAQLNPKHFAGFQIQYRNSYGLVETLQTEGARSVTSNTRRKVMQVLPESEGPEARRSTAFEISSEPRIQVNTGPVHLDQAPALEEIPLSRHVWFVTNTGQRFACEVRPGQITKHVVAPDNPACVEQTFTLVLDRQTAATLKNLSFE